MRVGFNENILLSLFDISQQWKTAIFFRASRQQEIAEKVCERLYDDRHNNRMSAQVDVLRDAVHAPSPREQPLHFST